MRKELEPDINKIKEIFLRVYKILNDFVEDFNKEEYTGQAFDFNKTKYKKMENNLKKLTGKNIKKYFLRSWLEEDELDNIAVVLSCPKAEKINNITREELKQIVEKIYPTKNKLMEETEKQYNENSIFETKYEDKINVWYIYLLEKNFSVNVYELFYKEKNSIDKIVEKIWDKK
jgi:hypothetical protein